MKLDKREILKGLGQNSLCGFGGLGAHFIDLLLSPDKGVGDIIKETMPLLFKEYPKDSFEDVMKLVYLIIASGDEEAVVMAIDCFTAPYLNGESLSRQYYHDDTSVGVLAGLFQAVNSIERSYYVNRLNWGSKKRAVNVDFPSIITEILKLQIQGRLDGVLLSSSSLQLSFLNSLDRHSNRREEWDAVLHRAAQKYAEGSKYDRDNRFKEIQNILCSLREYSKAVFKQTQEKAKADKTEKYLSKNVGWYDAGATVVNAFVTGAFGCLHPDNLLSLSWPEKPVFAEEPR